MAVSAFQPASGLIQTGRQFGSQIGSAFIQTFVRIQEQVTSNLAGLHLQTGADLTEQRNTQLSQLFGDRASSVDHSTSAALLTLDSLVRREAYVLAYIDAFWIVAWVLTASLVLLVFLKPPPPNHLTPPRLRTG
jgi:MFS transporter, DHA2 family, multidrug resistance protein